jgi:hypothetical protein
MWRYDEACIYANRNHEEPIIVRSIEFELCHNTLGLTSLALIT